MAITQFVLVCLGLCLLGKQADAVPAVATTAVSSAENVAGGTVLGSLVHSGAPTGASVTSQPNDGQIGAAVNGANVDISLVAGFLLDYEQASTLNVVIEMTDASSPVLTGTATVTITVTDVANEFSSQSISVCLSGTSYAAGSTLTTQTASLASLTGVAYSLTGQTPASAAHIAMTDGTTGTLTVAALKSINGLVSPVYTASIQMVAGGVTSTSVVTITFGCSTSGAATLMMGSFTLLLAMLVALLQ